MELNLLHFMWISYSFIVSFGGINVIWGKYLPVSLVRLYTFGKTRKVLGNQKSLISYLEVPKRWFSHFYVFASVYFSCICISIFYKYFANVSSTSFIFLLNIFGSPERNGTAQAESITILSVLLLLQVYRRCYECFFISIYSDSKMSIFHYIVGITFYFGVGLSLLHDAPGFQAYSDYPPNYYSGEWFTFAHCFGAVLFIAAFILQFDTHKRFASLRVKGKKVTSLAHYMPTSGFFEYVSCPHYFAEILLYLSGCVILNGKSLSWWLVVLWTVCNQVITAFMSHEWYKKTFKNYPPQRKAVIPFLL